MNCNTHAICSSIVSALADERHGAEVYESTFRYVLGTLLKVDEKLLAQHVAHYKQTKQDRDKAWVMKAVQSRVCLFSIPVRVHVPLRLDFLSGLIHTALTLIETLTRQICRPSMRYAFIFCPGCSTQR